MTKTELDLYIELQDVFTPFKGEWQRRDRIYSIKTEEAGMVIAVFPDSIDVEFDKRVGIWDFRDTKDLFWLPLPIDPVNPERGLWGMTKGIVTLGKSLFTDNCFVQIRKEENGEYKEFVSYKGTTPTEALLRALKAQEEGK